MRKQRKQCENIFPDSWPQAKAIIASCLDDVREKVYTWDIFKRD